MEPNFIYWTNLEVGIEYIDFNRFQVNKNDKFYHRSTSFMRFDKSMIK